MDSTLTLGTKGVPFEKVPPQLKVCEKCTNMGSILHILMSHITVILIYEESFLPVTLADLSSHHPYPIQIAIKGQAPVHFMLHILYHHGLQLPCFITVLSM